MKKKSTREKLPKHDSKREQNVILEKIYSEVKAIGEGHSILNSKLDKISYKVQEIDEINFKLQGIDRINSKLGEHDRHFKTLETAITEVDTRLKQVETKLDTVTTDHEHRLQKLETVR
jgi:chromosome segregation ATPase